MIQCEFERQTGRRPGLRAPAPRPDPPGPHHISARRAADHGVRLETPLAEAIAETARCCRDHREEL